MHTKCTPGQKPKTRNVQGSREVFLSKLKLLLGDYDSTSPQAGITWSGDTNKPFEARSRNPAAYFCLMCASIGQHELIPNSNVW